MKKIQVLMLALFAVLAVSSMAATAAFAEEETEFLVSGALPVAGQQIDSQGELLLSDHKGGLLGNEVMILCSSENLGEFLTATDLDITAIFPLGTDPGNGATLIGNCENQTGCPGTIDITPVDLPWLVELMLVEGVKDLLLVTSGAGEPGWTSECSGVTDTCTGTAESTLIDFTNETNGTVDTEFLETVGTCSRGGANQTLVEGLILVLSVEAGLSIEVN